MRFMRYDIVKDRYDLAMFLHPSSDISQRWTEIRHPVSYYKHIRFPIPYRSVCTYICKRIGRIQQGSALHWNGLIIFSYELCLSREEELRILSFEIECPDNMFLAQFIIKTCVKLRDSSSVRIETGQYCYFQLLLCFGVLCLDILFIESGKNIVCNVK